VGLAPLRQTFPKRFQEQQVLFCEHRLTPLKSPLEFVGDASVEFNHIKESGGRFDALVTEVGTQRVSAWAVTSELRHPGYLRAPLRSRRGWSTTGAPAHANHRHRRCVLVPESSGTTPGYCLPGRVITEADMPMQACMLS
jgi:hypothetical protein